MKTSSRGRNHPLFHSPVNMARRPRKDAAYNMRLMALLERTKEEANLTKHQLQHEPKGRGRGFRHWMLSTFVEPYQPSSFYKPLHHDIDPYIAKWRPNNKTRGLW